MEGSIEWNRQEGGWPLDSGQEMERAKSKRWSKGLQEGRGGEKIKRWIAKEERVHNMSKKKQLSKTKGWSRCKRWPERRGCGTKRQKLSIRKG